MNRLIFGSDGGQDPMGALAAQQIEEARKQREIVDDQPATFVQRLIQNQRSNPASVNDREIFTHAFGNITAGSDTTAIAMRSAIYYVLKDPSVHDKLREELRATLNLPISYAQAADSRYLTAVIREAIRMHPSVGMILGRIVPKGGAMIAGKFVPEGTEVGISPWVLHRDPLVFEDPNSFNPERWLTEDQEKLRIMNRSFFAFGAGPHTCSGRWISMLEITKLIATLFLRYDLELVDGGRGMTFKNLWFTPQKGLCVVVKRAL